MPILTLQLYVSADHVRVHLSMATTADAVNNSPDEAIQGDWLGL